MPSSPAAGVDGPRDTRMTRPVTPPGLTLSVGGLLSTLLGLSTAEVKTGTVPAASLKTRTVMLRRRSPQQPRRLERTMEPISVGPGSVSVHVGAGSAGSVWVKLFRLPSMALKAGKSPTAASPPQANRHTRSPPPYGFGSVTVSRMKSFGTVPMAMLEVCVLPEPVSGIGVQLPACSVVLHSAP